MNNFSLFLLTGISVIAISGGLTLLIIGLVQNKLKLWMPGLIVFVIALIIGISGTIYSLKNIVTNISHNIEKIKNQKHNDPFHYIFSDSTFDFNNPLDSTFSVAVSGFVNDTDKSLIYIRVYSQKELINKGVTVEKVNKGKTPGKSISLILNFHKEFTGNIKLTAFDYEKKELGSCISKMNKNEDEAGNINFVFPHNTKFSSIDYCTLTEAE